MDMHQCYVDEEARSHALDALFGRQLSEGPKVKEFEQELSRQLGLRNPVCVNSGTSALHLGLVLAGVGPGDEVILPPQTFAATGMAILMCGAKPVFADVDPDTGNLDPESVALKIRRNTTAVIPVHWGGLPCDLLEIRSVVRSDGLCVVEDAAHALGALYRGRAIGSVSQFTAFSFQAIKHLTTGDGGCLCVDGPEVGRVTKQARWFGINREEPIGLLGERESLILHTGFKYHMNDIAASIGLGNLEGFRWRLERRQAIGKRYREELEGVKGVKFLRLDPDRTHAYWVFPLLVERRDDFVKTLKDKGVPSSVVCRRIDRHPVFGGQRTDLPGMDYFDQRQINLPVHPGLTDEDVTKVVTTIQEGW